MGNIIQKVAILRRDILDNKFGVPVEIENHGTMYFASSSQVAYRYEGGDFYIKLEGNFTWAKADPKYFYFLEMEMNPVLFILSKEPHHNHPIEQINEVEHWKKDEKLYSFFYNHQISIVKLMDLLGCDRNSEIHRYLFRAVGLSLAQYYDEFYNKLNNPIADEYTPPVNPYNLGDLKIPGLENLIK